MSSSHGLDNDDLDDFDFFVTLAETSTETAENFARMKKLNVSLMYEKVADKYLKDRDYRSALKFNFLSKTPQLERISNFSLLGFYEEVANYVQLLFNTKCGEINEADRIHFATLAINCFVDMYRENRDDSHRIVQDLRKFLKENMYYDERIAIRLFLNEELFDLAAFCAKQRFNYVALVEALLGPDSLEYSTSSMQQNEAVLESEDYLFSNESYLECLISPQLVNAFLAKPTLTGRYLRFLTKRLPTLNAKTLNMVAVRLAPCNPLVQLVLHRVLPRMQQQYLSATDVEFVTKKDFLNFYTFVLLMISHGQGPKYSRKLVTSLEEIKSEKMRSPSGTENSKVLSDGVYAGQAHAAAIKSGVLYTWGESRFGRLGYAVDDFQQTFALPSPVTFFTDNVAIAVKSVSCGSKHTLILTDFGVYSCGAGSHGQLGLGEEIQFVQSPALVISLVSLNIVKIACGQFHSFALAENGDVYSFGWGIHGQLGLGGIENAFSPTRIKAFSGIKIVDITAGFCHSVALDDKGVVYTFGNGMFGQLGLGNCVKKLLPERVDTLTEAISQVATNYFHVSALTTGNQVYVWGAHPKEIRILAHATKKARAKESEESKLSPGDEYPTDYVDHFYPKLVNTESVKSPIVKVVTGASHYLLMTADKELYSWGRGTDSQLGHGTKKDVKKPKRVVLYNKVVDIAAGADFSLIMTEEGDVLGWGQNSFGQLGFLPERSSRADFQLKTSRRTITVPGSKSVQSEPIKIRLPESAGSLYYESLNYSYDIRNMRMNRPLPNVAIEDVPLTGSPHQELSELTLARVLSTYKSELDLPAILKRCDVLKLHQCAAVVNEIQGNYDKSLELTLKAINMSCKLQDLPEETKFAAAYYVRKVLNEPSAIKVVSVLFESIAPRSNLMNVSQIILDLLGDELKDYVFAILVLQYLQTKGSKLNLYFEPTFLVDLVMTALRLLQEANCSDQSISSAVIELISSDQSSLFPAEQMWQSILKNINDGVKTLDTDKVTV